MLHLRNRKEMVSAVLLPCFCKAQGWPLLTERAQRWRDVAAEGPFPQSAAPTDLAISVVVCTRQRGSAVVKTIESILNCSNPSFEMIVVDQSQGDATANSLTRHVERGKVHYIRTPSRGLAAARNVGIRSARSELIALTDDDCVVGEKWLERVVAAFTQDSRIGIVHGNVVAGRHDTSRGFVPSYRRGRPFLARSIVDKHRANGIGACMAVRKATWKSLWGFDEALGAGTPLRSAEELDFGLRALLAGVSILETPELYVVHHGFRNWADGAQLVYGHLYGIGAMFAKHLKCGNWPVTLYMAQLAWRWLVAGPVVDFGRQPSRVLRLKGFVRGLMAGVRRPVDRTRQHYV